MSQTNKNPADNPNRRRSFYLANIIFLCCLTIAALAFALIVYFRLRTSGTDGIRQLYTDGQIRTIEENAASDARNDLLLQIQSSLESGRSTTQMLREIFDDSIVVVSGGKYYFYPLIDTVEKNPLESGSLSGREGAVTYSGENPSVQISPGILLSDDNGKVDWNRLADSGVEETAVTVGTLEGDRFVLDQQFERNCSKAVEKGKHVSLCLEVDAAAEAEVIEQAMAAVREMTELYGFRALPQENEETEKTMPPRAEQAAAAGAANGSKTEGQNDQAQEGASAGASEGVSDGASAGAGDTSVESAQANEEEGLIDPTVILRIRTEENLSGDGSDKAAWTSVLKALCEAVKAEGGLPVIGTGLYTCAAQIDLTDLGDYDRWVIDHEEAVAFPYSFSFWEYSAEGSMEGVPGKSILYVRVDTSGSGQTP